MDSRKSVALVLLLFFVSGASAISVETSSSCSSTQEPLVSLNFTDGGHVGEPGFYPNQVCLEDVESVDIRQGSCESDENFLFSMKSLNNSHISSYQNAYIYSACSPSTEASFRGSCLSNETKVLSVASDNNTHAAEPSYTSAAYDQSLCFGIASARNVTLTLESSQINSDVYVDESTINAGETFLPPFAFPYIVAENPIAGIVSTGGVNSISRPDSNKVSITQDVGNEFYLPFTAGSYREVDDEEQDIVSGEFLSRISPSFGFIRPESPVVRVIHMPDHKVKGFDREFYQGPLDLKIENQGLKNGNLTFKFTPQ